MAEHESPPARHPLTLTVVGSAAAWSLRPGRASSCYLVELGGSAIVLDLGQGAFGALASRIDPATLSAVLVSHLHPDHCVDLVPLRHYLKYGMDPPGSVRLHGPEGIRQRFDAFVGQPGFLDELPGAELRPGSLLVGPFEVTVGRVVHTDESFAFRVAPAREASGAPASPDGGGAAGLVYSGDCGDPDGLVSIMRPGDTLLCEAFFGAGDPVAEAHHLNAASAARAARDGRAARLVLTHLLAGVDAGAALRAARQVYAGPVTTARPGLRFTIG